MLGRMLRHGVRNEYANVVGLSVLGLMGAVCVLLGINWITQGGLGNVIGGAIFTAFGIFFIAGWFSTFRPALRAWLLSDEERALLESAKADTTDDDFIPTTRDDRPLTKEELHALHEQWKSIPGPNDPILDAVRASQEAQEE